jgi:hypothetical protein
LTNASAPTFSDIADRVLLGGLKLEFAAERRDSVDQPRILMGSDLLLGRGDWSVVLDASAAIRFDR